MRMRRRRLLAALAGASSTALAGCEGLRPPEGGTETASATPVKFGTDTPTQTAMVTESGAVRAPPEAVGRLRHARSLLTQTAEQVGQGVVFRTQRVAIGTERGFAEWDRLSVDDLQAALAGAQATASAARGVVEESVDPFGGGEAGFTSGEQLSLAAPSPDEADVIGAIYERVGSYLQAKVRFYAATVTAFRAYPDAVRAAQTATSEQEYQRATEVVREAASALERLSPRLRAVTTRRARLSDGLGWLGEAATIPTLDAEREQSEHEWAAAAIEAVRPTYVGTVRHFGGLASIAAAFDSIEAERFDTASEQVATARNRLEAAAEALSTPVESHHAYFSPARESYFCLTGGYLDGVGLARESVAAYQRGDDEAGQDRLAAATDRLSRARDECGPPAATATETT
jgi:hypothetical protein